MWNCPQCGEIVDDRFDACWKCGTDRVGTTDPRFDPVPGDPDGPPEDEGQPSGDAPGDKYPPSWIVVANILSAFLVADFVLPLIRQGHAHAWFATILIGICIGQSNLIAVWAALAPGNMVVRVPWAILMSVMMWYAVVLGAKATDDPKALDSSVRLGVVLLGGVAVALGPLWLARRVCRWRLVSAGRGAGQTPPGPFQFHLRHLLLATAMLSAALAPARVVLPPGAVSDLRLSPDLRVGLAAVVVCGLLVTIPCVWAVFLRAQAMVPVLLVGLVYCGVLAAAECGVLRALFRPSCGPADLACLYLLNVSQFATVFGTLLVFRGTGFELIREPRQSRGA